MAHLTDCMTVHRDRLYDRASWQIVCPCIVTDSLWIKPTDSLSIQFLFIGNNNSTCFEQSFCPSSGASQPYNGTGTVYAARWPSATRNRKGTPDDGQKDCPKHVELLLPINKNWNSVHLLVLFTRNLSRCTVIQSVTMHGHTICHEARSYNLSRCTVIQSVTLHGHTICHDARSYNLSRCTVIQSVTLHGHTILKSSFHFMGFQLVKKLPFTIKF